MQLSLASHSFKTNCRIIFSIVLLEWLLFIISGVSFSSLYGNHFFSIGVDPVSWIAYLCRIPQFISSNQWFGILLDGLITVLLLLFIRNPFLNRLSLLLFMLLLLFYVTLMGHLVHRNYQFGFFMVFLPFLFKNETNKRFAYEATRYFLLFFYVSAAILKLYNHSLTEPALLSHLLGGQFPPYFLEGNTGLRTDANLYLINHPALSHVIYLASFIAESIAVVGFFTKRFDKWIAIIILSFHFGNWFLMDIAPWGQVGFVCLLFLSRGMEEE